MAYPPFVRDDDVDSVVHTGDDSDEIEYLIEIIAIQILL
jgi:hypothetical protein